MKVTPYEKYTLTLKHEVIDEHNNHHALMQPITVGYCAMDGSSTMPPVNVVLEELVDLMRNSVQKYLRYREKNDAT